MDSRDLEYVMAIARTGSFSQGAQMLFISQPALSQYIRRLEKNLGVTLFYRSRNKVELSPAGVYYVKKGQAILRQMQALEQTMRHWQQEEQRQLSIGVSQFYGKWFLTPYLQNIQKSLPQYQVRIVDGESRHLELLMIQRKLDFAIYPAPVVHQEIHFLPLGEEEILFAFSEENPEAMALLAQADKDGFLDLRYYRHFPFVLPKEGLKMHKAALNICRHLGFQPQSVYSSENLDTVYSLVNHNYGVGFLPDVIARNYNPRTNHVRFFHFKSRSNHRTIGLAFRDREDMKERIDRRVDAMVAQGLLQEVETLLQSGLPRDATALQAIGYKQFLAVAEGRATVAEAIAEVKLRSRQYAKRQLTWLRRNEAIHWILWEKTPDFSAGLQNATEFLLSAGVC